MWVRLLVLSFDDVRLYFLFNLYSVLLVEPALALRAKVLEQCLLFAYIGALCGFWRKQTRRL